jgi:hypothetical protein
MKRNGIFLLRFFNFCRKSLLICHIRPFQMSKAHANFVFVNKYF